MERAILRVLIFTRHTEVGLGLRTVLELANCGAVVTVVDSLYNAVEQARQECPDVALVDLEMPDGEGYKTLHQLSRQFPGIHSIALTAHDYPSARSRAMEAGARTVIVKGLEYQEFVAAIQAVAGNISET